MMLVGSANIQAVVDSGALSSERYALFRWKGLEVLTRMGDEDYERLMIEGELVSIFEAAGGTLVEV